MKKNNEDLAFPSLGLSIEPLNGYRARPKSKIARLLKKKFSLMQWNWFWIEKPAKIEMRLATRSLTRLGLARPALLY